MPCRPIRWILDVGPKTVADLDSPPGRIAARSVEGRWEPSRRRPSRPAHCPSPGPRPISRKAGKLLSVAGGGDTVAALAPAGVVERFSYVSTAGGAFLEWLEGKSLPGVAALTP